MTLSLASTWIPFTRTYTNTKNNLKVFQCEKYACPSPPNHRFMPKASTYANPNQATAYQPPATLTHRPNYPFQPQAVTPREARPFPTTFCWFVACYRCVCGSALFLNGGTAEKEMKWDGSCESTPCPFAAGGVGKPQRPRIAAPLNRSLSFAPRRVSRGDVWVRGSARKWALGGRACGESMEMWVYGARCDW